MNFCPHCGGNLKEHDVPVAAVDAEIGQPATDNALVTEEAKKRLQPKLADLAKRIDSMTKEEFGAWVDALEFDEFLVFIAIGPGRDEFRALAQLD